MTETSDVIVIGAGIAGASAAYHLAPTASVVILEAEHAPGYHTTGRSAALFVPPGAPRSVVGALVNGSEAFLTSPPDGFADRALLSPLGALMVAGPGEDAELASIIEGGARDSVSTRRKPSVSVRPCGPRPWPPACSIPGFWRSTLIACCKATCAPPHCPADGSSPAPG